MIGGKQSWLTKKVIDGFSNEEKRRTQKKKVCVFCGQENNEISYKDANKLKDTYLKEEKFFLEELQETVQNIRER